MPRNHASGSGKNKFNDKDREKFLTLLEKNLGNITRTCRQMRILGGHATICNWKKKYPWFAERISQLHDKVFDDIEENMFYAAVYGPELDKSAINVRKFLLSSHPKGRERGYAGRTEITGAEGGPITSFVELVLRAEQERKEEKARADNGNSKRHNPKK